MLQVSTPRQVAPSRTLGVVAHVLAVTRERVFSIIIADCDGDGEDDCHDDDDDAAADDDGGGENDDDAADGGDHGRR